MQKCKHVKCSNCKYFMFPFDVPGRFLQYREFCIKLHFFFPRLYHWGQTTQCEHYINKNSKKSKFNDIQLSLEFK